jgi:asparagine synthase (glutamine-hydrolysing)
MPFLDVRILELVASLPTDLLLRDGWTKWLLRKAMEDLVPPQVVWRKDELGFVTPEVIWLRASAARLTGLFERGARSAEYLDSARVRGAFQRELAKAPERWVYFWPGAINLELWFRAYF